MDEHGLIAKAWRLNPDMKSSRVLGRCKHSERVIELNRYWTMNAPVADVEQVILHEIAHALTPDAETSHGREWKAVARSIGVLRPKASTDTSVGIPQRLRAVCPSCGNVFFRQRMPRNETLFRHVTCFPVHTPESVLLWEKVS